MSFNNGGCARGEAAWAVVPANEDGSSATKKGDGIIFCRCFDVLLVTRYCGEAEASVAML